MSRLVASEIIRGATLASRIAVIEKWVAVADICRCLHNYNGVLQVRGDEEAGICKRRWIRAGGSVEC